MTLKLKGKIADKGFKHKFLAEQLGIAGSTFSRKLNNALKFTTAEMYFLSELLDLKEHERNNIFFNNKVDKQTTKENKYEINTNKNRTSKGI